MAQGTIKKILERALGRNGGLGMAALGVLTLALAACQVPGAPPKAEPAKLATAPVVANPVRASETEIVSLASLIGLPRERIAEFFGEPRQVRKENPAEVWQYSGAECVVDFYMYEGEGGELAVSFIEARDGSALETEPGRCFDDLLQRASL